MLSHVARGIYRDGIRIGRSCTQLLFKFQPFAYILDSFGPDAAYFLQIIAISKSRAVTVFPDKLGSLAICHYCPCPCHAYTGQSHQACYGRIVWIYSALQLNFASAKSGAGPHKIRNKTIGKANGHAYTDNKRK